MKLGSRSANFRHESESEGKFRVSENAGHEN